MTYNVFSGTLNLTQSITPFSLLKKRYTQKYLQYGMWCQAGNCALDLQQSVLGQCRVAEVSSHTSAYVHRIINGTLAVQTGFDRQLQSMRQTANPAHSDVIHCFRHILRVVAKHNMNLPETEKCD